MPEVHVVDNGKRDRAGRVIWQLYYRDDISGRRRWRSARTHRRSDAERAAARWESDLESGAPTRSITWDAFTDLYDSQHLAARSAPYRATSSTVLDLFGRLVDPARLDRVTAAAIRRFSAALAKRPGSTQTSYLKHLRAALSWAHRQGLLATVPPFPRGSASQARSRDVTPEEFDRLVAAVPSVVPRDAVAWTWYLRWLWWSGLRLSESLRVSWDPTDPLAVQQLGGRWYLRIYSQAQKSRRDELSPLAPEAAAMLDAVPADQRSGPVVRLRGPRGRPATRPDTVGDLVAQIGEAAGVVTNTTRRKHATAHDLRRSYCTRWSRRVRPQTLQRMARHASITTTMRYYVHLDAADLSDEIYDAASTAASTRAASDRSPKKRQKPQRVPTPRLPKSG